MNSSDCIAKEQLTLGNLPQPPSLTKYYTYMQYDKINSTYFPSTLEEDTLCWIFKSKGQQQKQKKKKQKVDVTTSYNGMSNDEKSVSKWDKDDVNKDDTMNDNVSERIKDTIEDIGIFVTRKKELFSRARIVKYVSSSSCIENKENNQSSKAEEQERSNMNHKDRYLVRYSKGSTYHVRPDNLLPVLEPNTIKISPLVIVTSDTSDYRRMSVVHTCIEDTFLEIGCDFGPCVHRVQHALENVPWVLSGKNSNNHNQSVADADNANKSIRVLGVDKSVESLKIANKRYPSTKFIQCDVLTSKGMSAVFNSCKELFPSQTPYPTVIALDINGNRELSTVLLCLQSIMNFVQHQKSNDGSSCAALPRLFIVKSVLLYQLLNKDN